MLISRSHNDHSEQKVKNMQRCRPLRAKTFVSHGLRSFLDHAREP
jgi:hypothetical protein